MKTKKIIWLNILIGAFLILAMNTSIAQWCGSDQMWFQQLALHPDVQQKADELDAFTQQFIKNYETQRVMGNTDTITYIIPIVFHILHQYGPENISDAQIYDEMRILNEDYAKLNPDTTAIATPHFKQIATNTKIQFRLAQIDPHGNPTNGIDRIYTYRTNDANDQSKLNSWDRTKYMNVWVCKNINQSGVVVGGTILGYAYFPPSVSSLYSASIDGVLINYQAIGSIGVANPGWDRCLTHELGHTLNLEHPWGLTNDPGVKCGGAGIFDLPHTKGWFSICPTDTNDAKICDTVSTSPLFVLTENWQNYMDYSFCSNMFTFGQAEAMWATLNSNQAGRNNLWSAANLIATGVNPDLASIPEDSATEEKRCAPIADFFNVNNPYNTCLVCQGTPVSYQDASWNAEPTGWKWTFTGASIASSTQRNPTVTYDSLWWQTVSLTASNSVGSSTKTKQFAFVSPLWTDYTGPFSEGFENPSNFNWILLNNANDQSHWQITSTASYGGQNSLMLNSFAPDVYASNISPPVVIAPAIAQGSTDDAITPSVAFNYLSSSTLSFVYACATSAGNIVDITESLTVAYSLNCGKSWTLIKNITDTALITGGQWGISYVPKSAGDWKSVTIKLPSSLYGKGNVRFRFEYTSGNVGNNLYIDNVNLSGVLGIDELSVQDKGFTAYPNPATENTRITISYKLSSSQNVKVMVSDVLGKDVKELVDEKQSEGLHTFNFNGGNLSQGLYFVKLITDDGIVAAKKLVIVK